MEVSGIHNRDTAVIGGKKPISFSISNSPEFFKILSTNLYREPIKAMLRETITNAWDAHIAAGKTDVPIEVHITDEFIIIKDFGKGIPNDLIGTIYGVYGGSTKVSDIAQTGGFGLGCKAPFAYTNTFSIENCYQGTKTIYQLEIANIDTDGKPSITPITTLHTKDTGLKVYIPRKRNDSYDISTQHLEKLVKQICYLGDIKYNDNTEYLNFPENSSYMWSLTNNYLQYNETYIKYGSNIYTISDYNLVTEFRKKFGNKIYGNIIFNAEPNSLVIAPSREQLVYCDKTINTIKDLFNKLNTDLENAYQNNYVERVFLKWIKNNGIDVKTVTHIFTDYLHLHPVKESNFDNLLVASYCLYLNKLPHENNDEELIKIFKKFDKNNEDIYNEYLNNKKTTDKNILSTYFSFNDFLIETYVPRLTKLIEDSPKLKASKLRFSYSRYDLPKIVKPQNLAFARLYTILNKNVYMITPKTKVDKEHLFGSLSYVVSSKKQYEEATKAFEDLGFIVNDWYIDEDSFDKPIYVKTPSLVGYAPLEEFAVGAHIIQPTVQQYRDYQLEINAKTLQERKYVVLYNQKSNSFQNISYLFTSSDIARIINFCGSAGIAVNSTAKYKRLISMGLKDVFTYLVEKLSKILSEPENKDLFKGLVLRYQKTHISNYLYSQYNLKPSASIEFQTTTDIRNILDSRILSELCGLDPESLYPKYRELTEKYTYIQKILDLFLFSDNQFLTNEFTVKWINSIKQQPLHKNLKKLLKRSFNDRSYLHVGRIRDAICYSSTKEEKDHMKRLINLWIRGKI